jgi:hypothetical protein
MSRFNFLKVIAVERSQNGFYQQNLYIMKKRNLNSLALKKTTISNFLVGGMVDSDNACPSAITCESNCFCIPDSLFCQVAAPLASANCASPANESPANAAGNYENAAG